MKDLSANQRRMGRDVSQEVCKAKLSKRQASTDSLLEGETKKALLVFNDGLDVSLKVGAQRHAKVRASPSPCGSKQACRTEKSENLENVLLANL